MLHKLHALRLISLCLGALYLFAALAHFPTLLLGLRGYIPWSTILLFLLEAPILMLRYGEPLPTFFFFLSALLSGIYVSLLIEKVSRARARHIQLGLSGSLLSIVSIGCVACGALLSPLALAASIGVPIAILGYAELSLGAIANALLAIGIFFLWRERDAL